MTPAELEKFRNRVLEHERKLREEARRSVEQVMQKAKTIEETRYGNATKTHRHQHAAE
jgi:hypothetical protein